MNNNNNCKKFKFGLRPNPNMNINEIMYNLQVMTVQENIRELFGVNNDGINEGEAETFYFTPLAGQLDTIYRDEFGRRMDFEITNVIFDNNDPFIPRISGIHIIDDPGNPNNIRAVSFYLVDPGMIEFYDIN